MDASIVVDWVAPGVDPRGPATRLLRRLTQRSEPLLAPHLLVEEVSNALLTGIRRRRWSGAQADSSVELLNRLPVQLADTRADLDRAWELSRRYDQHPLYDMLYVATAERVGHRLVTADAVLAARVRHLPFVELLDDV